MRRIVLAFLGAMACALMLLLGQQPDNRPQGSNEEACPDMVDTTGTYVNTSYGFSIVIPKGLRGTWNSARCVSSKGGCACMSDHGRIIPLSTDRSDTDHWIEAYAGFATDVDDPTPGDEVESRLGWIRERSRDGSVSVLQRSDVRIGGLKGKRVVVRYYDKESNRVMVEDFVEALRGSGAVDVEYSIY